VFRGHVALSWKGVELKVLGDKAIGISRQGAIQVPKDASHLATVTEGALAAVEPSGTLISHGASGLKAPFKGGALVQIDAGHTRNIEILVVLGRSDTTAHPGMHGVRINVAHQNQVVIERRGVQIVGQVVHEVASPTFDESMIIMEDVASSIVEHSSVAAEGREALEVV